MKLRQLLEAENSADTESKQKSKPFYSSQNFGGKSQKRPIIYSSAGGSGSDDLAYYFLFSKAPDAATYRTTNVASAISFINSLISGSDPQGNNFLNFDINFNKSKSSEKYLGDKNTKQILAAYILYRDIIDKYNGEEIFEKIKDGKKAFGDTINSEKEEIKNLLSDYNELLGEITTKGSDNDTPDEEESDNETPTDDENQKPKGKGKGKKKGTQNNKKKEEDDNDGGLEVEDLTGELINEIKTRIENNAQKIKELTQGAEEEKNKTKKKKMLKEVEDLRKDLEEDKKTLKELLDKIEGNTNG